MKNTSRLFFTSFLFLVFCPWIAFSAMDWPSETIGDTTYTHRVIPDLFSGQAHTVVYTKGETAQNIFAQMQTAADCYDLDGDQPECQKQDQVHYCVQSAHSTYCYQIILDEYQESIPPAKWLSAGSI